MPANRPSWSTETEVIRRLDAEWRDLADSPRLRGALGEWARDDARLSFESGSELVAAAQNREASNWVDRDRVLAAVLERFVDDPLARRVALQIVLPQIKSLISGIRGWDTEERAARVVAAAVDVLAHCAEEPASTPPSFRFFSNTRRRVLRAVIRDRSEPLSLSPDLSQVPASTTADAGDEIDQQRLDGLIEWVRDKGGLSEETARLVVLTRAGGVAVRDLASATEVSVETIRQRRLRAERQLRRGLALSL
jgi:hypothetical protein